MFSRSKEFIKSSGRDVNRFIEDKSGVADLSNSLLLKLLDEEEDKLPYTINRFDGRVDLISKDIYGTDEYSWILMYTNRLKVDQFTRGTLLWYIPLKRLKLIFDSI